LLTCSIVFSTVLYAQIDSTKKFYFEGYITSVQSLMFDSLDNPWYTENMLHNRLNLMYCFNQDFRLNCELRNRFVWGMNSGNYSGIANNTANDKGYLQLSKNWFSNKSAVFNTSVERFFAEYEHKKLNIRLGRQRINWSQTFVWNPNDIFNTYSFFDFDYEEKSGSDALRFQYYLEQTSTLELAAKIDCNNALTMAGLYRFNWVNYDIQVLAGLLENKEWVIGTGWSGAISNWAFRGEASCFVNKKRLFDSAQIAMISIGCDYSFTNSLSVNTEILLSTRSTINFNDFLLSRSSPIGLRNMVFCPVNIFAHASYPLNPLISASIDGMYFPKIMGFFAGPSVNVSLSDNLSASINCQAFSAKPDDTRLKLFIGYFRMKYSL
jgi:hypothetical protein